MGLGETKWRKNQDGYLECVDLETNEIIFIEKPKEKHARGFGVKKRDAIRAQSQTHHWALDSNGRKHWVLKGTNPDLFQKTVYPYCETTVDAICSMITEGHTISEIADMDGMPSARLIFKWSEKYPEFKTAMKNARAARAEFFADQAIITAEGAHESTVQASRLQVETYKWAAEVGNRNEYGKQTKVTGDPDAPIGFILDTGIRKPQPIDIPTGPTNNPTLVEAPASGPGEAAGKSPEPVRDGGE
jgi:hypothetical protein